jgi:ABC-type bacteriocin/lantibiotic exporter with double-glycine peptidase domain
MKIRHVYQPDDTGCGVACIAMIAGLTYQQVKDKMMNVGFFKKSEDNFGTTFKDMTNALKIFNINPHPRRRKFKKWKNIPAKLAITSTNYDKSGDWHWVVFVRDLEGHFIYDPGKRRKKIRDLRGKKASGWFIEIF